MMQYKKPAILSLALVILLGWAYLHFMSRTMVGTLNFPDFTVEKMIRSNDNPFVKIRSVDLDDASSIENYDMVLVRIHGSSLTKTHLDAIRQAIARGVPVYATERDNEEINSLSGRELDYVATLMDNESVKNYRSLFNYIRKNIDHKIFFNGDYHEPVYVPADYFFHLGNDQFFATYAEYQKFYEESGLYKKDAPRVALLSGNINMQNSNEEHMTALVKSLEEKGLNVYPINSFGMKKLQMLREVKPDLIINRPHGRLVMGGGESGTELLKQLNVPILAPVTVSENHDKWLESKQGMTAGGMTSMSVVLPELDGAIAPFAVAAQFERNGLQLFDAIPGHTEKFCRLVKNFTRLQQLDNSQKKIAIYYYKGTGKGAMGAADIEGVQSLYNTLILLRNKGYKVEGLPASAAALEEMIQKSGSVLGTYALGAYDRFLKEGNPALVDVETFKGWCREQLPEQLVDDMKARYGEAPGDYMSIRESDRQQIAVARIELGNVAILPQPMPSVGEDVNKLVHGTEGAPAYPYVASYLWTRNAFGANAVIHFGTHGSLEFIPGKQIALSDYDWSDALIADMPHFYIYTISNIGEGIIAKRRSYATLLSHLTSPFMQGDTYGELEQLHHTIMRYELLEEGNVREQYAETITRLAKSQNILSALSIDSTRMCTSEDIDRIHIYVEEIEGAKVSDGLYTLGVPYTREQADNTARLMGIDAVRYSLASLDAAEGRIDRRKLDHLTFVVKNYTRKAESIIRRAFRGEDTDRIFRDAVGEAHFAIYTKTVEAEARKQEMMRQMMMKAMAAPRKTEHPKFFDEQGNLQPLPAAEQPQKKEPAMSMMSKMAEARSMAAKEKEQQKPVIDALRSVREAIAALGDMTHNLSSSTLMEQEALIDALNGGYVEPGSAGDPIVNPRAVPTGKNFYSINPETTPTPEAWKVGRRLAENLLEAEFKSKGKYPEKVSFTLWATDFISSEGATVAQILYLLGVEPLRDGFGYIRSLQLIPQEVLQRPRIDVVVQTSGQLRDLAASRLELINRAVAMAAEANEEQNFVRKGLADAERHLLDKGFSPADARRFARERVFGGVGGNYGTGIMGMVEQGDSWEDQSQIAERYIANMSAIYSANGGEDWGIDRQGVFEAALLNTSVVVQPRSSNTWGPLSLDHVYEFMGGISAAVKHVTGNDPTGYFNDFRNTSRAKVQELKEAIGVETNSTIFNPKYISHMMRGEASALETFAETFRNTFGWNAMKPSAIDQHIWNKYYDIYVRDELHMGLRETFAQKNPYALQEMTAVMLESARKGMWKATPEQVRTVAELHSELVRDHEAGCSGFICDNKSLRDFIAKNLDEAHTKGYQKGISAAREVQIEARNDEKNVVLKKEETTPREQQAQAESREEKRNRSLLYVVLILGVAIGGWILIKKTIKR